MSNKLTTIYRATNSMHAHLFAQLLAERDVPSQIVGDSMLNVDGVETPVSVMVPQSHAEFARFIAESFERNILQAEAGSEHDTQEYQWHEWPKCHACGAKRMTWCTFCSTIGTEFELADTSAWGASNDVLLLCSICDEPFEPRFHRNCASCGRRFADGIESEPVSGESGDQIWRSVFGAILFLAAFLCLAWWVLRS